MYVELHCHSAFSFLDGVSLPDDLVAAALSCGYDALALTDHNSLSGSMEFAVSARSLGLRPIHGAEIDLDDERHRGPMLGLGLFFVLAVAGYFSLVAYVVHLPRSG